MAIAGLPPLNGFASEWLILESLVHVVFHQPLGVALAGAVALAGLAATAALALLCFVKVLGLVLLGRPRREACAVAVDPPAGMLLGMGLLALMCIVLGLVPGLVLPTLAGLAPGSSGSVLLRHAGLVLPGTGSYLPLPIAIGLTALVAALIAVRGKRRAAPAPTWACGQPVVAALSWSSAGFTKPLRVVLDGVLRPRREITVVRGGGMVQSVTYEGDVPSLLDGSLYEPTVRAGLRAAALARRLQSGNVRAYAAYLLGLVIGLLVLVHSGVLG